MRKFSIKVFESEDTEQPLTEYQSRVVPEQGDCIMINRVEFVHVNLRMLDSNNPYNISVFGSIEQAV